MNNLTETDQEMASKMGRQVADGIARQELYNSDDRLFDDLKKRSAKYMPLFNGVIYLLLLNYSVLQVF